MKILFVHQNFPGQFPHLAPELMRRGHDCRVLTDQVNQRQTALKTWRYKFQPAIVDPAVTRLGRNYTVNSDRGVVAARAALTIRDREGFSPDLIIGHSGWGETLFLKEVWPEAKLLVYSEFYYRGLGQDVGFDPEFSPPSIDQVMIAQGRAAHLGQALLHADRGLAPTQWQASTLPPVLRGMVDVIFDGVDTDAVRPDPTAQFTLPSGQVLKAGDEVLTFVNRNLEPYRGYHVFMRMLPQLMRERPEAQVVLVGGNEVSYGAAPKGEKGWKDRILNEVRDQLDLSRVHFTGKLPYHDYLSLMQVSRAHAYLTYPFVLSWSMVEAMAAGALVIGSRTAPVEEMIRHGETGLLVDFFDQNAWARQLAECLAEPERFDAIRARARAQVLEKYDLKRVCLPAQVALVEGMVP
ncbi:glycosyltransferase [Xinfangfangia sp. D13-10-4-6]|uniref:glycosyltransferase n=1 Tax=Pseudogemmobacter hezensis TaxID=2737662 RepID=UPI0015556732|nr:glycosyltransferase [Pseudogemmobacter hezensis]NPD14363.1 glycosyltransferase [Pseudogemmobacter hezensis]